MINTVPDVPKQTRANFSPTAEAIDNHYQGDPETLLDAMIETYLYGMNMATNGQKLHLLHKQDPDLSTLYQPAPGRCLWGWDKVALIAEKLGTLPPDTNLLLGVSMRPSRHQEHLHGITPLHALLSVGALPIHLLRLGKALEVPTKVSKGRISEYFLPQNMGAFNQEYWTQQHEFLTTPPRNSKRSAWQHYAIENSPATAPLQVVLLKKPPVYDTLRPKIQAVFERAKETTTARLKLTDKVIDMYLGLTPDPIKWEALFDNRDDIELLTARQMVAVSHSYTSCDAATTLLSGIISGVSPAVLARTALEEMKIKGLSFLDANQVIIMQSMIEDLPYPKGRQQQADRSDLTLELIEIAEEMDAVFSAFPLSRQEELYWMKRDAEHIAALGQVPIED